MAKHHLGTHHLTSPLHRKAIQRLLWNHSLESFLRSHLTDSVANIQVFWQNWSSFFLTSPHPTFHFWNLTLLQQWFDSTHWYSLRGVKQEPSAAVKPETADASADTTPGEKQAWIWITHWLGPWIWKCMISVRLIGLTSEPCREVVLQLLAKSSLRTSMTSRGPSISRWYPKYNS